MGVENGVYIMKKAVVKREAVGKGALGNVRVVLRRRLRAYKGSARHSR